MAQTQITIGQLRWRCRRGTKELDRILGGFLEENYLKTTEAEQQAFVALLECQDPDIYDWLMGFAQPNNSDILNIINILRDKFNLVIEK